MNDIERAELEAEDDGYRNDYQRAHAVSQMCRTRERAYAEQLVSQGLHVIVEISTAFCPITDGIIGEHVSVRRTGSTRGELEKWLASLPADFFGPECSIQIWPHGPDLYGAEADYRAEEHDDIPF